MTSFTAIREWNKLYQALDKERYDLIEYGLNLEHFHCCEDNKYVKNKTFDILKNNLNFKHRIDTIIWEKNEYYKDKSKFYAKILGQLLSYIFSDFKPEEIREVVVITDNIPIQGKKEGFKKAIKQELTLHLSKYGIKYRVLHHASKSHFGLQIADYFNWAIFRKWERGDEEYYNKIKELINTEITMSIKITRPNDPPNYP